MQPLDTLSRTPPPEPMWLSTMEAARLLRVNRKTLDALSRFDVPGGPVDVGLGARRMLRWPAHGLAEWLTSARRARPRSLARAEPLTVVSTPEAALLALVLGAPLDQLFTVDPIAHP